MQLRCNGNGLGLVDLHVRMQVFGFELPDTAELVEWTRGTLLTGYRGLPRRDVLALKNVLIRISALVESVPEIHELDINPVFVAPPGHGVIAADALVVLK